MRYGDFDEPDSLAPAFAGGDRLLLISTLSVGRRAAQHGRAIDAAKAAGIGHVVYTSTGGMHPDNPAIVVPDHRATEERLKASGLDFTLMRDSLYAEAALLQILPRAIGAGRMRSASGEGKVPFVAKAGLRRLARSRRWPAKAMPAGSTRSPVPSSQHARPVRARRGNDRARVEFVPISDEEFDADLAAAGIPAEYEEGHGASRHRHVVAQGHLVL